MLKIGWSEADITPAQNVLLAGQFYARISEGVDDPVTATALAIESDKTESAEGGLNSVVMISCDLVTISDELRDAVREHVHSRIPELPSESMFLGATHTHSAPQVRTERLYGVELDAMDPAEYVDFASKRIADAVKDAWEKRTPSGIAYGLGHAVVGHNRRMTYKNGLSKMYGSSDTPDFSHVEGYEDHSLAAMMTYDEDENLTGVVVNVPCPSQVNMHSFMISADYWHETRQELRRRFGEGLHILAQCAPAGDQSPTVLVGKRAEERMWRLKGLPPEKKGASSKPSRADRPKSEIAGRIADAISGIVSWVENEIEWAPDFGHKYEVVNLPRRMISEQDVRDAEEDARPFKAEYEKLLVETNNNPALLEQPEWYKPITRAYRKMKRGERVKERFELQKTSPFLPIEAHVIVIGDIAFATNPFELYLDYGVRIRELSNATQTFLIQKAGCSGTYLPSRRSIACKGYGSVPASTEIGPKGGDKLVEWTVDTINSMGKWDKRER